MTQVPWFKPLKFLNFENCGTTVQTLVFFDFVLFNVHMVDSEIILSEYNNLDFLLII